MYLIRESKRRSTSAYMRECTCLCMHVCAIMSVCMNMSVSTHTGHDVQPSAATARQHARTSGRAYPWVASGVGPNLPAAHLRERSGVGQQRLGHTHLHDGVRVRQGLLGQVPLALHLQLEALGHVRHQDVDQATDAENHVLGAGRRVSGAPWAWGRRGF